MSKIRQDLSEIKPCQSADGGGLVLSKHDFPRSSLISDPICLLQSAMAIDCMLLLTLLMASDAALKSWGARSQKFRGPSHVSESRHTRAHTCLEWSRDMTLKKVQSSEY